jgi:hypothetical protein
MGDPLFARRFVSGTCCNRGYSWGFNTFVMVGWGILLPVSDDLNLHLVGNKNYQKPQTLHRTGSLDNKSHIILRNYKAEGCIIQHVFFLLPSSNRRSFLYYDHIYPDRQRSGRVAVLILPLSLGSFTSSINAIRLKRKIPKQDLFK